MSKLVGTALLLSGAYAANSHAAVSICYGITADNTGSVSASAAIQQCIDQGSSTVDLPAGTYLITSQLRVTKPITIRTLDLSSSTTTCTQGVDCAVLKAAPSLSAENGMLYVGGSAGVSYVTLDHLVLDGNRLARIPGPAYSHCTAGGDVNWTYGDNAVIQNCQSCQLSYSASINTLCGTSMGWRGDFAVINNNLFANNGDNQPGQISDGLTFTGNDSTVRDNTMRDNTDVSLIVFGAQRSWIQSNSITQTVKEAAAGLMLDGWVNADFSGTTVRYNTITCASQKCFFGMNIGPFPWYTNPANLHYPIYGGTVFANTIYGGTIGLNVNGTAGGANQMTINGINIQGTYNRSTIRNCPSFGTTGISVRESAFTVDPNYGPANYGNVSLNNISINPELQSTTKCFGNDA
jgi:hypothetical protein